MGYFFSLYIECGADEQSARELASRFEGMHAVLADGSCELEPRIEGAGGVWRTIVWLLSSTHNWPETNHTHVEQTLVPALYERLRGVPPDRYRYALAGVEVDDFRMYEELDDDVVERNFSGLVLADATWRHLGAPQIFVPFAPGYRWRPFNKLD